LRHHEHADVERFKNGPDVSLARKLHTALPASTLAEIPDAAHMAHFDNPQAWLAGIRGYLCATR
jgi:pimeloyl-ACP methyl ester carboxylesterase